ncbi:MAG: nucleotidyltransferase family protein [Bacteroidetes bacterium]|nr:nucleotidyltransferase family protein [Bacteroidota bacterium]
MIKEAIILAGGLGTRLRSAVNDLPKSMADVNGKPFLHYLFLHLQKHGISKAVLSVGYMAEKIESHFGKNYLGIEINYAYENEPIGTGGGIRLAMEKCSGAHVLAMNGDSFLNLDLKIFSETHLSGTADATLALRKVNDASRYGTVQLDGTRIIAFREKDPLAHGNALINAGVYALRMKTFLRNTESEKSFSIELDFFGKLAEKLWLQSFPCDGYFIDIGIPEDYERAKSEFGNLRFEI